MQNILFIGLGHMGHPMVCQLLKAGYPVTVYDVVPSAMATLTPFGAKPAISLPLAFQHADIVITMLQTGAQVSAICLGPEGLFAQAKPDILYIDSSSIDIATTQELHKLAEKSGLAMLDAPVSGGVLGATAATLTFMVGGATEQVARAKPLLEKMGKKIIHAGSAGHGQAAKICNNLILGISMIAVSEGFTLGEKLGLDPKTFFEISSNASGQCWSMTSYCPVPGIVEAAPSSHQYQPGFMAKMMLKDLRLGQLAAESVGASLPLGTEATALYTAFVEQGNGDMDFSAIIKMIAGPQ